MLDAHNFSIFWQSLMIVGLEKAKRNNQKRIKKEYLYNKVVKNRRCDVEYIVKQCVKIDKVSF